MIEETAEVVAVNGNRVYVEVLRKNACDQCAANKGCGTSVLQKVLGNKRTRIEVSTQLRLQPGDRVALGMDDAALVKGSFILYLVPIVLMIVCAIVGEQLAPQWSIRNTELMSIGFAVIGLGTGWVWLRYATLKMKSNPDYQPVVLRKQII